MPASATSLQTPIEMFGASPGITVIDPATVLTRLWYFDGKFLRADGFRKDQQYVRSLVALANQAAGHGVVHGFDARMGSGDSIEVDGGLAVAPSGRIVYLPQGTTLPIAQLIARSIGEYDPSVADTASPADFSLCTPNEPQGPDQTLNPSAVWLLTVAAAEALCGEEERFGNLCEDACATETDRSEAVEGVVFRARRLTLSLPASSAVTLTGLHHRSRVASAFYEAERRAISSGISGAGLRSSLWCRGAEGVGSEEVTLAVFNRAGAMTSWLDMWTARREVMETTPQRYWGWRFAMRPLDVFLAQVLQFQCQLIGLGTGTPGVDDPCADERQALQAANALLSNLLGPDTAVPTGEPATGDAEPGIAAAGPGVVAAAIPQATLGQLAQLNVQIANTLAGNLPSASGSALVDGGIIELPSGGYLPVDPAAEVTQQVRAFMGPGVDLRFCAVRPDFIPEALQEAQHMERISLTQGIDDPDDLEEVDILVPNGTFEQAATTTAAFEGAYQILRDDDGQSVPLFQVHTYAREHTGQGWSWTSVLYQGLGDAFESANLSTVVSAAATRDPDSGPTEAEVTEAVSRLDSDDGGSRLFDAERERRIVLPRRALARNRIANRRFNGRNIAADRRNADPAFAETIRMDLTGVGVAAPPPVLVANPRPGASALYGWLDFVVDQSLTTATPGSRVPLHAKAVLYVNALNEEWLADFDLNGGLTITSSGPATLPNGQPGHRIVTMLDGGVSWLIDRPNDADSGFESGSGIELEWFAGSDASAGRSLRVRAVRNTGRGDASLLARFTDFGVNREIGGLLTLAFAPASNIAAFDPIERDLASLQLTQNDGVFDAGTVGRDIGESVIEVLAGELAERQRAGGFASTAPQRLFAPATADASTIRGTADWVMFHRRRTKVCGGEQTPNRPVALRRYRWFHAHVGRPERAAILAGALGPDVDPAERAAIFDRIELRLVTEVEFPEASAELLTDGTALRLAFQNTSPSTHLALAAVADTPAGDGPAIAAARLQNALSAISSIADSSGVQIQTLAQIPPEHQATGVDGVLYTVGHRPVDDPQPTIVRAPFIRTPTALLDTIERLDGDVDLARISTVFERFQLPFDTESFDFEDDDLLDVDQFREWWGDRQVGGVLVGFRDGLTEQDQTPWLVGRSASVTETAGGGAQEATRLDDATFSLDQDAVLFLLEG